MQTAAAAEPAALPTSPQLVGLGDSALKVFPGEVVLPLNSKSIRKRRNRGVKGPSIGVLALAAVAALTAGYLVVRCAVFLLNSSRSTGELRVLAGKENARQKDPVGACGSTEDDLRGAAAPAAHVVEEVDPSDDSSLAVRARDHLAKLSILIRDHKHVVLELNPHLKAKCVAEFLCLAVVEVSALLSVLIPEQWGAMKRAIYSTSTFVWDIRKSFGGFDLTRTRERHISCLHKMLDALPKGPPPKQALPHGERVVKLREVLELQTLVLRQLEIGLGWLTNAVKSLQEETGGLAELVAATTSTNSAADIGIAAAEGVSEPVDSYLSINSVAHNRITAAVVGIELLVHERKDQILQDPLLSHLLRKIHPPGHYGITNRHRLDYLSMQGVKPHGELLNALRKTHLGTYKPPWETVPPSYVDIHLKAAVSALKEASILEELRFLPEDPSSSDLQGLETEDTVAETVAHSASSRTTTTAATTGEWHEVSQTARNDEGVLAGLESSVSQQMLPAAAEAPRSFKLVKQTHGSSDNSSTPETQQTLPPSTFRTTVSASAAYSPETVLSSPGGGFFAPVASSSSAASGASLQVPIAFPGFTASRAHPAPSSSAQLRFERPRGSPRPHVPFKPRGVPFQRVPRQATSNVFGGPAAARPGQPLQLPEKGGYGWLPRRIPYEHAAASLPKEEPGEPIEIPIAAGFDLPAETAFDPSIWASPVPETQLLFADPRRPTNYGPRAGGPMQGIPVNRSVNLEGGWHPRQDLRRPSVTLFPQTEHNELTASAFSQGYQRFEDISGERERSVWDKVALLWGVSTPESMKDFRPPAGTTGTGLPEGSYGSQFDLEGWGQPRGDLRRPTSSVVQTDHHRELAKTAGASKLRPQAPSFVAKSVSGPRPSTSVLHVSLSQPSSTPVAGVWGTRSSSQQRGFPVDLYGPTISDEWSPRRRQSRTPGPRSGPLDNRAHGESTEAAIAAGFSELGLLFKGLSSEESGEKEYLEGNKR
ncbi:hypothetical protein, conserved [Eimeria maxima]|uniref:Transmembrane protein n=1 Tax=Eimeria maxima TaxID=5804 RepID=U6MA58_EIMMA|nr:hypothetical protein, conserved [Eimeria maxima]CDJ60931.1 hypothetical protein, conserved [Eimeria maxima]